MPPPKHPADPRNPYPEDKRTAKTFTIPVSGSVDLYGPELDIVKSPEFQRLAGLKQLGTSYVVFRGAVHTRFEHSVGALHEAERMITAINNNPYREVEVDGRGRRLARLGALLHDLPHVPFGHTLEDEFHLLRRHDENEARLKALLLEGSIGKILRGALDKVEYEKLIEVLKAKTETEFAALGQYAYVADLIGNTLCADLLDYVTRDLTACGMAVATGDRFLNYLTITGDAEGGPLDHYRTALNIGKRGMPRPDVESEIVKLLSYRYELAERVYFHHAKNAASVMIGRAVQEAGLAHGEDTPPELDSNFHRLSDEMLLHALHMPAIHDALNLTRAPVQLDLDLASRLAGGVLQRQLFKIAYLAVDDDLAYGAQGIFERHQNPAERRALENRLADQAGVDRGNVLVHIPRPKMMTKEADIRVRTDRGEIVPLKEWDARHSRRVNALNEAHRRLWRLAVYVHPDLFETHGAIVRAAAESEFGAPARYVSKPEYSPLMSALFDRVVIEDGVTKVDKNAVLANVAPADVGATRQELEAGIRERIALVVEGDGELEAPAPEG